MNEREWALAWARFYSLKANPPFEWDENEVSKYHEILELLEGVSGESLSAFRVAESKLKQKGTSIIFGSLRRPPRVTTSEGRYCDDRYMCQQLEGVEMYFQNLEPASQPKTRFGY